MYDFCSSVPKKRNCVSRLLMLQALFRCNKAWFLICMTCSSDHPVHPVKHQQCSKTRRTFICLPHKNVYEHCVTVLFNVAQRHNSNACRFTRRNFQFCRTVVLRLVNIIFWNSIQHNSIRRSISKQKSEVFEEIPLQLNHVSIGTPLV